VFEQEIQTTLRDEIKSMCEYRPYENNDYAARTATEISVKKLDCVTEHLNGMEEIVQQYTSL
jgi:mediator of RNA polymerase II transcription subunit 11